MDEQIPDPDFGQRLDERTMNGSIECGHLLQNTGPSEDVRQLNLWPFFGALPEAPRARFPWPWRLVVWDDRNYGGG